MVPEPGLTPPEGSFPAAPPPGQPAWPGPGPSGNPLPAPGGAFAPPPPVPWPPAYPPVPPMRPPKPPALPVVQREYHEFFRAPRLRWWKPLAAFGMFLGAALVTTVALVPLMLVDVASGRLDPAKVSAGELQMTPMLFLVNNLSLALWVPLAFLTAWAVFGQRPKWLSSITGGFRWGLFGRFALISFVVLAVSTGIQILLGGGLEGLAWNPDSLFLIVTILLTTPFQAAGEEYALRGLGARCLGAWFSSRRVGLVVATVGTSVVFMLLHGAGDPWLNSFYLLFAVVGSVLAWRTGGLEAAVALHVVNNLISEATLPFSSLDGLFDRQAGVAGPETLWQMGAVVVVGGLMLWQARRLGLPTATAPAAPPPPGERALGAEVFWNSSHTIA